MRMFLVSVLGLLISSALGLLVAATFSQWAWYRVEDIAAIVSKHPVLTVGAVVLVAALSVIAWLLED